MRGSTICSSRRTWYRVIPAQGFWVGAEFGAECLGEHGEARLGSR